MTKTIKFTNEMDTKAVLEMMESYLRTARLTFDNNQRIEAIKRIKDLCEGLLK